MFKTFFKASVYSFEVCNFYFITVPASKASSSQKRSLNVSDDDNDGVTASRKKSKKAKVVDSSDDDDKTPQNSPKGSKKKKRLALTDSDGDSPVKAAKAAGSKDKKNLSRMSDSDSEAGGRVKPKPKVRRALSSDSE